MKRSYLIKRTIVGLLSAVMLTTSIPVQSYALEPEKVDQEGVLTEGGDENTDGDPSDGPEETEVIENLELSEEQQHVDEPDSANEESSLEGESSLDEEVPAGDPETAEKAQATEADGQEQSPPTEQKGEPGQDKLLEMSSISFAEQIFTFDEVLEEKSQKEMGVKEKRLFDILMPEFDDILSGKKNPEEEIEIYTCQLLDEQLIYDKKQSVDELFEVDLETVSKALFADCIGTIRWIPAKDGVMYTTDDEKLYIADALMWKVTIEASCPEIADEESKAEEVIEPDENALLPEDALLVKDAEKEGLEEELEADELKKDQEEKTLKDGEELVEEEKEPDPDETEGEEKNLRLGAGAKLAATKDGTKEEETDEESKLMAIDDTELLSDDEKSVYEKKKTAGFWTTGIDPDGYTYGSSPVIISGLKVFFGGQPLVEGRDYSISYKNNSKPGTGTVTITGKGNYSGTYSETFKINAPKSSSSDAVALTTKNVVFSGFKESFVYSGESQLQTETELKVSGNVMAEGTDYIVSYSKDPVNVGSYTVTYTGVGGYKGSIKKNFKITAQNMSKTSVEFAEGALSGDSTVPYRKGGAKPGVTVSLSGRLLVEGVDYSVSYKNNTKSGAKGTVTVNGRGNLTGSVSKSFTVGKNTDTESLCVIAADKQYTAKAGNYITTLTITDSDGKRLAAGTDYKKDLIYRYVEDTELSNGIMRYAGDTANSGDMVPPGAILELSATLTGSYSGTASDTYRIVGTGQDISKATVRVGNQYYTGKPICPDKSQIMVTMGKIALSDSDYDIISYENNVAKGTAKLTIRGCGEYGGTKTATFTIAARTTSYMIAFYGNGATSGNMSNQQMPMEKQSKLTANKFVRANYTFTGWNTAPDGSGQKYANQAAITPKYRDGKSGDVLILYAQWKQNSVKDYKIIYHHNDGKTKDKVDKYNVLSGDVTLYTPDKSIWQTGYQFAGWYKENTFKNKVTSIKAGTTGDFNLYAKWIPFNYTIHYEKNGANSGSMPDQTLSYGVYTNLAKNTFKKNGSAFLGWTTIKGSGDVQFTDGQMVKDLSETQNSQDGRITLYAIWSSGFGISYELGENASFGKAGYPTSYVYGKVTNLSGIVPARHGFDFAGWYKDAALKSRITSIPANSTGDITLYAKWTPWSYKIQYNPGSSATGKMSVQTVRTDGATMPACSYKYAGNSFVGWNTKADGSGNLFYTGQIVGRDILCASAKNGTVNLYAIWEKDSSYSSKYKGKTTYTINFDANAQAAYSGAKASGKTASMKVNYGQVKSLSKNTFVIKGYEFTGWNTKRDGSGSSFADMEQIMDLDQKFSGTVTLYATWKKQVFTIAYENLINGNGGNPTTYTSISNTITLKTPASYGQVFAGWYSDPTLKKKVTSISKGSSGDKVFYAKWTTSYCNISYDLNYNNKAPVPVLDTSRAGYVNSGTSKNKDYILATARRTGYRFGGWYKEPACRTPIISIPATSTVDMTVYAKWIANCSHYYVASEVIREATCTADGLGTRTCRYCGDCQKNTTIPKLGHQRKLTKSVAATCTTDGVKEYTCERCGKVLSKETFTKLGHDLKLTKNVAATCTAAGVKEYTCNRCKKVAKKETIPKLGHKEKLTKTVAATCATEGGKTYTCERCKQTTRTEVIPKLAHKEKLSKTEAADCTKEGKKTYVCEKCGKITRTETIAKLGHSFKLTESKAPTCLLNGRNTYTCTRCNIKKTETVAPTGHNYAWVITKAATTSATGQRQYVCQSCGQVNKTESIPKLAGTCSHSEQVKYIKTEANCVDKAHYSVYCGQCGKLIKDDYVDPKGEKNSSNHVNVEVLSTVDATYTTAGSKKCRCKDCGKTYTETIPKLTCTHNYRTRHEVGGKGYVDCYYCGEILEKYTVDKTTCSHSYGSSYVERVSANATTWGETDRVCYRCAKVLETIKVHPYQAYQVVDSDGVTQTLYGWFDYGYAKDVWRLTNQYRSENGTTQLSYNESLQYASDLRALEAIVYWGHNRPDGSKWNTIDPKWQYGGENLAMGYATPENVMVGWKNSPGHDRNLKYGVGASETPFKGISVSCFHQYNFSESTPGRVYETLSWVQNFTFYQY